MRIVARGRSSQKQKKGFFSRFSLAGVLFFLAIPIIPLGTAALAIPAPLTRSPALNLYTAITMGIAGLMLLQVPIRAIRNVVRPPATTPSPVQLPPIPTLTHLDAPIAIRTYTAFKPPFRLVVMTALVCGNIYPLIRSFQDYSNEGLTRGDLTNLPKLAAEGLIICVGIGILIFCAILFDRPFVLLADAAGLIGAKAGRNGLFPGRISRS